MFQSQFSGMLENESITYKIVSFHGRIWHHDHKKFFESLNYNIHPIELAIVIDLDKFPSDELRWTTNFNFFLNSTH